MLSPDKCVLSNLNNIHVQNASTGVNVASHIVDVGAQLTQGETWGKLACKQCQDKRHNLPELDANCNNPSLQCKSCEAHSQQLLKLDFTNGENHMISDDFLLANSPTLAVSPSDFTISPLSSSISSCSDFESDATTNSICSKELPLSGQSNVPRSPDGQPDIIPLDENPDLSCSSEEKFQPACNSNKECSSSKPRGCINFVSLDDLESTLRSQKNKHNFFGVNSSTEQLDAMKGDNTVGQMIVSGPENPMNQSNLKIPAKNNNYEEIDCNSNTIANQQSANNESVLKIKSEEYYLNMKFVSKADQMAHKVQSKHSRSLADDKEAIGIKDETSANTGIQSKPFLLQQTASTIPHESEPRNGSTNNSFKQHMSLLGHQCKLNQNEPIKKNITSFHELAQKRKKSILGQASQVKSDKSDWLILFSPDTEFPPPNELTQTVFTQDQRKTPPEHGASAHREVTTFKELKYKNTMNKQNGQQGKSQVTWAQANASSINGAHLHHSKENLHEPMRNKEDSLKKATEEKPDEYKIKNGSKASANGGPLASDSDVLTQLKTHVGYYFESGPRRKSMSTLQPIVEGNSNEMEHSPAAEGSLVTNRRPGPGLEQEVCQGKSAYQVMNPTFRGKADGGDKDKREVGPLFPQYPRPQSLQFQPLLLHISTDGRPLCSRFSCAPDASVHSLVDSRTSSLESIELKSPVLLAPSFYPKLKTFSCDEVCLLAGKRGKDLGYVSPEQLLPVRLSPVGAYSPPQRGVLPLLGSPDLTTLFSPLFPRSRTFPTLALPSRQALDLPLSQETFRSRTKESQCTGAQAEGYSGTASYLFYSETNERPFQRNQRMRSGGSESSRLYKQPGRSQSFTEPFRKGRIWMGSREWTLSQQAVPLVCLQQKRGLLNAVSSSVDKIVSHFSTTRNLVQKAQLGDSRISPEVGHLVLQGLCPALYAIVGDELKPYQNDLIVGRRKNSPWHVVEASVKPGPSTKSLYSLYCKIHQLSQLSNSKTRFNAFIFGLLNVKQLDFWISHLKKCTDVLAIHYSPTAFLSLTEKPFLHLFEELLLLLQPLSVFTFSLDLLFEYHHHFQVDERHLNRNVSILQNPRELCGCSPSRRKETDLPANSGPNHFDPVNENGGSEPRGNEDVRTVQDWSTKASHEGKASLFENEARGESGQLLALNGKPLLEQFEKALANGSLQTTLHQVRQWGDKLANTLMRNGSQPGGSFSSLDGHQGDTKSEQSPMTMKASKEAATGKKPASWWEQLSETSRVYVSPKQEGFLFAKWIRAKSPENANTCSAAIPGKHDNKKEADLVKRDQTSQQHPNSYGQMGNRLPNNPAKSSSIRQADSTSANGSTEQNGLQTSKEGTHSEAYPRRSPATEEPKERATQVNGNISCGAHDPRLTRSGSGSDTVGSEVKGEDESPTSKMWLGRLFGANSPSSKGSPDDPEMAYRPRRPSSWLAPNVNVFDFMHKGSASEKEKSSPPQPTGELSQSEEATKQLRAVKALCDHASAEEEHLSFKKGDVLQVLSSVDEDWIRCCHGDEVGLVPIGYTSIIL
nr:PREDICTED: RUN and SH3 domain-containing protein 1 isoform X1 [Latimeria chalumnae]|eukprot:XP_014347297.1 PREDICTED: RUN and SH3 domain-containing protein 1 isoform X1 [Latimeria chalumnae]